MKDNLKIISIIVVPLLLIMFILIIGEKTATCTYIGPEYVKIYDGEKVMCDFIPMNEEDEFCHVVIKTYFGIKETKEVEFHEFVDDKWESDPIDTVKASTCSKCRFHKVYTENYNAIPGV